MIPAMETMEKESRRFDAARLSEILLLQRSEKMEIRRFKANGSRTRSKKYRSVLSAMMPEI
mgnify:CR=1 FL=1